MFKKIGIGAALVSLILIFASCASPTPAPAPTPTPTPNPTPKPSGPIEAAWIEPQVDTDSQTVFIPVSEVEDNWNIHFGLETEDSSINFMVYIVDGEIYVRSNVCPPCRSVGFSLEGDILVCDRCATTFEAKTGDGIEGACVDYPKAAVPYEITNDKVVMKGNDLLAAYEETLLPG